MSKWSLLALLVGLVLAFALYRLTRRYLPKVHYNANGDVAGYIARMKMMNKPYRPTPWLIGPNIHTVWGMRYRPNSKLVPKREEYKYEDGGNSIFDWFEPKDCAADAPILIIVHTLAGGTREPCTNNMAESAVKHGWRVVVANSRGCSGAKFTSKRNLNAIETDDFHALVAHIRKLYKPSHIFMAGFSLGAMQSITYSNEEPEIDGIACVSHTYIANEGSRIIEKPLQRRLYLGVIMEKLRHLIKKNPYLDHNDPYIIKAEHAKTLAEFDDFFTSRSLGFKNHVDYYEKISITGKMEGSRVPLLLLGSDDDPFTSPELMPIEEAMRSKKSVLVHVPEGGHVSFCEGLDGKRSYAEEIVLDWFDAILNTPK